MATIISRGPEETVALGERWGRQAQAGWVIALCGDLGAGKTQFVKGLARGLGFQGRVHSPTFALVNEYTGGRLPLHHLDLYRLETAAQVAGAGLHDLLESTSGVVVVEWAERWLNPADPSAASRSPVRFIRFEVLSETERAIHCEDPGS